MGTTHGQLHHTDTSVWLQGLPRDMLRAASDDEKVSGKRFVAPRVSRACTAEQIRTVLPPVLANLVVEYLFSSDEQLRLLGSSRKVLYTMELRAPCLALLHRLNDERLRVAQQPTCSAESKHSAAVSSAALDTKSSLVSHPTSILDVPARTMAEQLTLFEHHAAGR